MQRNAAACDSLSPSLPSPPSFPSFLLLKTYIDGNIKMGWEAFRPDVDKNIENKCRSMGASAGQSSV